MLDTARKLCYTVDVAHSGKGAAVVADVFISYHEKSAGDIVRQIAAALEDVGVSCWYAQRDLIGPGSFAAIIAREIRNCKVFLLVMNEESNQSEHVKNEIGVAFHRISEHEEMALALFRLDNCKLPDELYYYLNRFQITDGNPPDTEHIQQLANQIADVVQPEPPTWEMVREQRQRIRELENKVQTLTKYIQVLTEYKQKSENLEAQLRDKRRIIKEVQERIRTQAEEQARLLEQAKPSLSENWDLALGLTDFRSVSYPSRSDALKRLQKQVRTLAEEQTHKMEQLENLIFAQAAEQMRFLEELLRSQ